MADRSKTVSPINLQRHLGGIDYPASKEQLIEAAEHNGAPQEVVDALRQLEGDHFESPVGVEKAFGTQ